MPVASKFELAHWKSNVIAQSLSELQSLSEPTANIINTEVALGYGTNAGSRVLRERIAETLCNPIQLWGDEIKMKVSSETNGANGITAGTTPPINADNVLVTIGTSTANLLVLDYLVGPGDHVICQYPTYAALFEIPRRAGAAVSLWRSKEENRWIPDVEELESMVQPNTKMIIMNNPNNPTGAVTTLDKLQAVVAFCKKHSLILFCDEIFRPLFHSCPTNEEAHVPPPPSALHLGYPRTIVTGSLSKAYSLPGLRIGWIATPMSDLLQQFLGAADYTTICVSALDDQVAAYALEKSVREKILARSMKICQENLALWDAFVEKYASHVSWVRPSGCGTGWLRVKAQGDEEGEWVDDAVLATDLVKKTGLLVVPGAHCFSDADGGDAIEGAFRGYLRVAIGNKPEATRRALDVFGKYLEERE